MLLPGFVRKLLAVFRGNVAPPLVFVSVLLGFWTGMMPGWSGLHTLLAVIVLILNVHLGLFLLTLGLGKALSLAAAPVLYHVGFWVHEHATWLPSGLSSIPIVGITDFGRFAVVGGLLLGPIVGAVAGLALAMTVVRFRRMMFKLDEKSEKFRLWYSKTWVRLIDRLLIGKRAKDVKAMFAKPKYVRKVGVALAVLLVAGVLVAAHFAQDTAVRDYATRTLTRANKAQVDLEDLGISLLGGNVSVSGLQFTDPQQPQQNQLAVATISADADIPKLLVGRLVLEKVEVSDVQFGQARETPGRVLEPPGEEAPADPNDGVGPKDLAELEEYVKDAKKLKEQLEKLRNWLPDGNEPPVRPAEVPHKYLDYLLARAAKAPAPRVLAREVLADKVVVPSELFRSSRVTLTNVSDAPKAAGLPVTLEMKSYDTSALLTATVDYSKGDGKPEVSGTFEGFDLSRVQSNLSPEAGLAFQSGQAAGTFAGTLTRDQVDLTIDLSITDLQAKGVGDGVLGLGASQTSEVMQNLQGLKTTIRVVGPTNDPRLVFDVDGLTKQFQQALVAAGKERLGNEIEKQIEKNLGDKVPQELQDALKKPGKDLIDGLGGLLGGKKKDD